MTDAPNFNADNAANGRQYEDEQADWLKQVGYLVVVRHYKHPAGVEIDIVAIDLDGQWVGIECKSSQHNVSQPGLARSDTRAKVAGSLHKLRRYWKQYGKDFRYVLITSHLPERQDKDGRDVPARDEFDLYELDGDLTVIHRPWANEA
jgi:Holliday junction resolvase-like predicted endonuclease